MTTDTAPTCPTPPSAMLMGLTGFDEIAIAAHYGDKIATLREDPITMGRALAFTYYRRDRDSWPTDADAYRASMLLTMGEVMGFFAPEPPDDDDQADDAAPSAEGNSPAA